CQVTPSDGTANGTAMNSSAFYTAPAWTSSRGTGKIYLNPGLAYGWDGAGWAYYSATHAIIRGGSWNSGPTAGLWSLSLNNSQTYTAPNVGFRCTR
ncbi:MAG: hypothetical protein WC408_05520, partial [Candidatus Micrarchaeia archaeon]